jgi:hypothetical protein
VLPASDPQVAAEPIQDIIRASPPKKGAVPYSIRYDLPVSSLTKQNINGEPKVVFGVAAVVLNGEGRAVDTHAERVTLTRNELVIRRNPDAPLIFDQRLNFKKEDQYLYLALWDMASGRLELYRFLCKYPRSLSDRIVGSSTPG